MESWATELTHSMDEIQHKLEEQKENSKKNKNTEDTYREAVNKVSEARTAISRFVGTFDRVETT